MAWEPVHTITDWYDGPIQGTADFRGGPHSFERIFDYQADEWSNEFTLRSIDQGLFNLMLESWGIWVRWRKAFQAGETTIATHPALPDERRRHEELTAAIETGLRSNNSDAFIVVVEFRNLGGEGTTEVRWTPAASRP